MTSPASSPRGPSATSRTMRAVLRPVIAAALALGVGLGVGAAAFHRPPPPHRPSPWGRALSRAYEVDHGED
jgi:hypothetical protein